MHTNNRLLAMMSPADRARLIDRSELTDMAFRTKLEEPHERPTHVYFIESGIASLMYRGDGDHTTEVALVGREGCTGCGIILGSEQSAQVIAMQTPGSARRIATEDFTLALERSPALHRLLLRFVHTLIVQRDETALAASSATILQRLARWLLMVEDRLGASALPLTHELVAFMLSTRRAGVTEAIGVLTEAGFIETARGRVIINDRNGLKQFAKPYYGAAEAEYDRLFGPL